MNPVTRDLRWADQSVIPYYCIDKHGSIYNNLDRSFNVIYKQKGKKKQYWHALLRFRGRDRWLAVHRLMCYTWLGEFPHPLRFICDHIDSNSLNNEMCNLRYLTIRGNNLNRKGVKGVIMHKGKWCPRIAGFVHKRFGHEDKEIASLLRKNLLQSYIRFTNRFPANDGYPHKNIMRF